MRRWVLVGMVVLVGLALVAGGVYLWQRPMLLTGTGYAAHNACAVTEVAGRDDPDADLPPNPLVPALRTELAEGSASTSVLGLLARQQAWATPRFGCALAGQRPALPEPVPVPAGTNPLLAAPAPAGSAAVEVALDRAFGDDLAGAGRAALGTRGVVVLKDGVLVGERYAPGFDATTPQLGWSMTKSVANLVVGRLVQQGAVSLDDDRLLPEWTDGRAAITVRDLLQMTSGLAWDETYDLGTPITQMLYAEPDMGAYVAGLPLANEPGSRLQYSSGSTTLLCSILARDHGGANLPRTTILAPLGLAQAVLETDAAGTPSAAPTCGRRRGSGRRSASSPWTTACGTANGCCRPAGWPPPPARWTCPVPSPARPRGGGPTCAPTARRWSPTCPGTATSPRATTAR